MEDLTAQITREYEREHAGGYETVKLGELPISYEAITPEWLTDIVCRRHPGAKVVSHTLDAPDEGNTNRRRIFLEYNAAGEEAGLPASVFCKAAFRLANRLVLAHCELTQGETWFYNDYRPLLDIEAPKSIYAHYSKRSYNAVIMLDDLVRHGATFCKHNTDMTRQRAESQLALLAKVHGKFYDSLDKNPVSAGLRTFEETVRRTDQWFDLRTCSNNGFLAAREVIPERLFQRYEEIWPATQKAIDLNGTQPRTLMHNDTHLRNWYIAANGEMGLNDWQGICAGDWCRDVAYAISTALTVENRRAWEKELLWFYLEKLRATGARPIGFEAAWTNYRKHLFTALAWWTLTLRPSSGDSDVAPPDFQPADATMEFIRRTATAIDDLDGLRAFG